jgi:hypothetical protein
MATLPQASNFKSQERHKFAILLTTSLVCSLIMLDANGSGLGLAIARQAVIVNGGKIFARSCESGGLTVIIELPASVLQTDPASYSREL